MRRTVQGLWPRVTRAATHCHQVSHVYPATREPATPKSSICTWLFVTLETMASTSEHIFKFLRSLVGAFLSPGKTSQPRNNSTKTRPGNKASGSKSSGSTSARPAGRPSARPRSDSPATGLSATYPGDFRGTATVSYSPKPDGVADPGEIVWTWVPYEEDHSQGKDRPVLIVGKSGKYLLALMMTSKDHDNDRRGDNDYVDIGSGAWDKQGRDSEVKLDRILQVSARDLRREGAILNKQRFNAVAIGLRQRHGWK